MKANAVRVSEGLLQRIRNSHKCGTLIARVPAEEHKRATVEIYLDLMDWLAGEADAIIEERYVAFGVRRAQQKVPYTDVFWAVCLAREYLWEYMQQECLLEEPVEFWGGVVLLHSLNQFFDRVLYYTLTGYYNVGKGEAAQYGVPA
jgi:hypothetical protein